FFFFSSRRRHTRFSRDWSSDVCSSDLMHHRESNDFLGFEATRQAAQRAYAQAGVTAPRRDLDVVECHDCFAITEILNTEDLGLRSEERRVGKERRARWPPDEEKET